MNGAPGRCLKQTFDEAAKLCEKDTNCVAITQNIVDGKSTGYEPRNNLVGTSIWPGATSWRCNRSAYGTKQKVVTTNNGNVSCDTYCRGVLGHSWNADAPPEWNGAKCVGSSDPRYGCKGVPGILNGPSCERGTDKGDGNGACPQSCTCEATGTGWYQGEPAWGTFQAPPLPPSLSDPRSAAHTTQGRPATTTFAPNYAKNNERAMVSQQPPKTVASSIFDLFKW
jgi:hypothetical protein